MSIAEEILMFRSEYDQRMERVTALKEQIARQSDTAHEAARAAYEKMITTIDQHLDGGDLQKLAGHRDLLKSATIKARAESEALKKLQAECVQAQALANEAFPDHIAHLSEMRVQIPPVSGGRYFSTSKGEAVTPFVPPPTAQPPVDPNKALFDVQLARRFQGREQS